MYDLLTGENYMIGQPPPRRQPTSIRQTDVLSGLERDLLDIQDLYKSSPLSQHYPVDQIRESLPQPRSLHIPYSIIEYNLRNAP